MQKFLAIVALMVMVAVCIEAQGGRGRGRGRPGGRGSGNRPGRRPRLPMEGVDKYQWEVDLGAGDIIPQKGIVIQDKDVVTVVTFSRDLAALNLTRSVIIMNTTSGDMAMKAGFIRSPCFLTTTTATKAEIVADFAAWNGSTITFISTEYLDGTGTPMTTEEKVALYADNPGFRRFCRRGDVIRATTMTGPSTDDIPETQTFDFLGYDSMVSLLAPERPEGEGRGPGRRPRGPGQGQRPGGRGQGGRGQGRQRGGRRG